MTLAQIMTLALRQLDEDIQDLSEYEDVFRVYANIGHDIAGSGEIGGALPQKLSVSFRIRG